MNELFSFTITVFEKEERSEQFKNWYEKVWVVQNPKMKDFDFSYTKEDGIDAIEVMSHNANFPLSSLFEIYSSETNTHACPDCDALNKIDLVKNSNLN